MKNLNRWTYILLGVFVMLLAGLIYAWSVFSIPIAREFPQWSKGSLALVFTICMSCFCLGGLLGGILLLRLKARSLIWISAVLLCAGFYLASLATSLPGLMLSYGLLCGMGSGLVYNCVISTVSQWFPDKQGLCSGILLMGFGFGSFLIGKVFQGFTPVTIGAWRGSFRILGVIILIVFLAVGAVMTKPEGSRVMKNQTGEGASFTTRQMILEKSFWFYQIWTTMFGGAGLILISHASGIAMEAVPTMTPGTMSTVVGLISIFNGLGRVMFGSLFDRIGRGKTMTLIIGLFLAALGINLAGLLTHSLPVLVGGFIVSGVAYGGITPTNSTFVATFFGRRHFALNFPVLNLNLLISSFSSSLAGSLYDASRSYITSFYLMIGLVLIGSAASLFIRKPIALKA